LSLGGGHSDAAASAPRGASTSTRRRRQHNASGDGDWDGEEQACHGGSPLQVQPPLGQAPLPLPLKKRSLVGALCSPLCGLEMGG
jgi:hypothetical protein